MAFLKRLDRVVFVVLLVGMAVIGWRILGDRWRLFRTEQQEADLRESTGIPLNEERKQDGLEQVQESYTSVLQPADSGMVVRWTGPVASAGRPYFWKKEVFLRNNKRYRETDTYVFPLKRKGSHLLHFDFFPDSLPERRFRARLVPQDLPTIHSFELPQSREARLLRDSLLTEWRIPLP